VESFLGSYTKTRGGVALHAVALDLLTEAATKTLTISSGIGLTLAETSLDNMSNNMACLLSIAIIKGITSSTQNRYRWHRSTPETRSRDSVIH
jgi:hypothetical protein